MTIRPLAALKSRLGELNAIGHLPVGGGPQPRVLLELTDGVGVGAAVPTFTALIDAASAQAAAGRPLWVDTHLLGSSAPLSRQPGGAWRFLDEQVEDAQGLLGADRVALVPVVAGSAVAAELRAAALLREHREREVVVRVGERTRAPELADNLRVIERETGAGTLHAVIDLGFVDTVVPERANRLVRMAEFLLDRFGPGSTTLLAGSIPEKRVGYATTTRERPEVALWRMVNDRVEVGYGDYGVTHPALPAGGSGTPRTPFPYLHYTVPGGSLALRRKVDRGAERNAAGRAFSDLAEELLARPEYAGPDYSWGDRELSRCPGSGGKGFGSVPRWIGIATSHHLAHLARHSARW